MANFNFKQVVKNLSVFPISKKSLLLKSGLHAFFMYFIIVVFCVSSPALLAQFSPHYEMALDSAEMQQRIEALSATGRNTKTFLPQMKRSEALFCRWEYAIEQHSRIPFRFRLGTVDYVDQLEKKK